MKGKSGNNRAALAYQILGRYLPDEVFQHLSSEEIESLLLKVEKSSSPSAAEEKKLLLSFTDFLQKKSQKKGSSEILPKPFVTSPTTSNLNETLKLGPKPEDNELYSLLQEILKEEGESESRLSWSEVSKYPLETLRALTSEESPEVIARILAFSDPEIASEVIAEFPEAIREGIILALAEVDYHSERERDSLDRFLRFKTELIENKLPLSKIKSRKAKTAGEILTRLPFLPSQNLIERIQKKSPEYAETIVEHYFRLEDLLHLGRTSLTRFFSEIHPLVIACALKGVEPEFCQQIYENLEAWLVKEIKIEWDSLGPISLAEIEEAQKGILDRLREAMDEGKVKLWRVK